MLEIINAMVADKVEYYETHQDYLSRFFEFVGDTLQLENKEDIPDEELDNYTMISTYNYFNSKDVICSWCIGEIEEYIETDYTDSQIEEIKDDIEGYYSHKDGIIVVYICTDMVVELIKKELQNG